MLFTRRAALKLALFSGIAAATIGLATAPLAGGGIALLVDMPRPDDDPRLQEAVLTARARGCAGVNATITATAEGVVNGKRVSQTLTPIDATPTDKGVTLPVIGIRREWPREGTWVVSIVAKSAPYEYAEMKNGKSTGKRLKGWMEESIIVSVLPDGSLETRATPGGKYDRQLHAIRTNRNEHTKTVTRLLTLTNARLAGIVKR